jgi:O-antigen/teichoic acid export membrane protein
MYVMWFIAIIMLIANLGFVPRVLLQKSLRFDKLAFPDLARHISYSIVTISLAYLGFGYWSLAAGVVASTTINIAVLIIVNPKWPKIELDRKVGKELLNFGKFVLGSAIVIFAITNLDDVVVGKAFGVAMLGLYVMAWRWANLPVTHITHVINSVMFPTYASIQDEKEKLKKGFELTLKYVSILTIPATLGLLLVAPYFTKYILGDNWVDATIPLQILCFYGLERSLAANSGSIFNAIGKPEVLFNLSMASLISKVILFVVLLPWGIVGIAFAMSSSSAAISIANIYYAGKFTKSEGHVVAKNLLIPFVACLLMIVVSFLLIFSKILIINNVLSLLILVAIAAIVYVGMVYILDRKSLNELFMMLRIKK